MPRVPTVKIHFPHETGDYAIINKSRYDADPDAYTLYDEREDPEKAPESVAATVAVTRKGGGHWSFEHGGDEVKGQGADALAAALDEHGLTEAE